ncbi:hypothetical protein RUND412_004004 [Rhizina undulata]
MGPIPASLEPQKTHASRLSLPHPPEPPPSSAVSETIELSEDDLRSLLSCFSSQLDTYHQAALATKPYNGLKLKPVADIFELGNKLLEDAGGAMKWVKQQLDLTKLEDKKSSSDSISMSSSESGVALNSFVSVPDLVRLLKYGEDESLGAKSKNIGAVGESNEHVAVEIEKEKGRPSVFQSTEPLMLSEEPSKFTHGNSIKISEELSDKMVPQSAITASTSAKSDATLTHRPPTKPLEDIEKSLNLLAAAESRRASEVLRHPTPSDALNPEGSAKPNRSDVNHEEFGVASHHFPLKLTATNIEKVQKQRQALSLAKLSRWASNALQSSEHDDNHSKLVPKPMQSSLRLAPTELQGYNNPKIFENGENERNSIAKLKPELGFESAYRPKWLFRDSDDHGAADHDIRRKGHEEPFTATQTFKHGKIRVTESTNVREGSQADTKPSTSGVNFPRQLDLDESYKLETTEMPRGSSRSKLLKTSAYGDHISKSKEEPPFQWKSKATGYHVESEVDSSTSRPELEQNREAAPASNPYLSITPTQSTLQTIANGIKTEEGGFTSKSLHKFIENSFPRKPDAYGTPFARKAEYSGRYSRAAPSSSGFGPYSKTPLNTAQSNRFSYTSHRRDGNKPTTSSASAIPSNLRQIYLTNLPSNIDHSTLSRIISGGKLELLQIIETENQPSAAKAIFVKSSDAKAYLTYFQKQPRYVENQLCSAELQECEYAPYSLKELNRASRVLVCKYVPELVLKNGRREIEKALVTNYIRFKGRRLEIEKIERVQMDEDKVRVIVTLTDMVVAMRLRPNQYLASWGVDYGRDPCERPVGTIWRSSSDINRVEGHFGW